MVASINFLAPAPYAQFSTRNGNYSADANGFISNVPTGGTQIHDLIGEGCIPLAANPLANFRNLFDGGDFTVNPWQRNVAGLATSGVLTTAITSTPGYFPDRWFAVSGSGSGSVLMSQIADTTVPGFSQSCLVQRSSANANTAAITFGQVIESADAIKTQGQYVTFSFYARQAANYSGGSLSVALNYGTGSNQSAANLVAGSWTGQISLTLTPASVNGTVGAPALQPINSSMQRYAFTAFVPANATQLGATIAYTPSGTAGTTDGVYFNGLQLEIGASASPFEHRDIQVELEICQRYAWLIAEPAAGVIVAPGGGTTANHQTYAIPLPVQQYKGPTVTLASGSFQVQVGAAATAATSLTAGATHTPTMASVTTANTASAGIGALLEGGGGSGYILASSDF